MSCEEMKMRKSMKLSSSIINTKQKKAASVVSSNNNDMLFNIPHYPHRISFLSFAFNYTIPTHIQHTFPLLLILLVTTTLHAIVPRLICFFFFFFASSYITHTTQIRSFSSCFRSLDMLRK